MIAVLHEESTDEVLFIIDVFEAGRLPPAFLA